MCILLIFFYYAADKEGTMARFGSSLSTVVITLLNRTRNELRWPEIQIFMPSMPPETLVCTLHPV